MIKELVHDPMLLASQSAPATADDLPAARDLLDTLAAHRETCVGMAANMIGVHKRIIVFVNDDGRTPQYETMFNPEIIAKSGRYETREGCLSLLGDPRPCVRYRTVKVRCQTETFATRIKTYSGWTAEIIQHEIDHCNGVLI